MTTFFRIAGWLCLVIALICLLSGFTDMPRMLGVAILSMGFWGGLGLLLLFISRLHKPA
jgi:hypothetical protein